MKGELLVPTGNAECDLLSFAANRQFSATSPELPASEDVHATGSIAKRAFAYCARRPLTGLSVHKYIERQTKKSRCQSAHEPRWKNNANQVDENRSADDGTRNSRSESHFSRADSTESVPPSIQEIRKQLHALKAPTILGRPLKRTQSKEGDSDAKLRGRLHLDLRFERESPRGMKVDSSTDKFLDQDEGEKEPKARRRLQKSKKSKKNAIRWKNSVVPLPAGSHFDNLIRSGAIAKHIAKRERKRRCW